MAGTDSMVSVLNVLVTTATFQDDHALEGDEDVASLRVFQIAEGCTFFGIQKSMKVIIFCF